MIIWDEASMSSQRLFKLVNVVQHQLTDDELNKTYPFAGKQMVLVGEFLQLRPVPSMFDEGNFMFLSPLFTSAIPHRFELTQIMRQSDPTFLQAISEIRLVKCSKTPENFLSSLQRDLSQELDKDATHIFFRKVNAHLLNIMKISELPGEILSFDAKYENAQGNLQLKENCKIMMVWNKSKDIRNVGGGARLLEFVETAYLYPSDVGTVEIDCQTSIKRDCNGMKVGSVTQFPIVPAYAITCHKSQGLTLPAVVLHCSREYVPGLIYVAISRVKSPDHIQVLNFNANQLLEPGSDVIAHSSSHNTYDTMEDLSCCCHRVLNNKQSFKVTDRLSLSYSEVEEVDDSFYFPVNMSDEQAEKSFEDDIILVSVDLAEVYELITENESGLAMLSEQDINKLKEFLLSLKSEEPHSTFICHENAAVEHLSKDNMQQLQSFISVVWCQAYVVIRSHIIENGDRDDIIFNLERQHFTMATAGMHEFFTSPQFQNYMCHFYLS